MMTAKEKLNFPDNIASGLWPAERQNFKLALGPARENLQSHLVCSAFEVQLWVSNTFKFAVG
jgi:hypothetical protein